MSTSMAGIHTTKLYNGNSPMKTHHNLTFRRVIVISFDYCVRLIMQQLCIYLARVSVCSKYHVHLYPRNKHHKPRPVSLLHGFLGAS